MAGKVMHVFSIPIPALSMLLLSCSIETGPPYGLVTLDPGHFHAALVQKTMYDAIDPAVSVYAPPGPDVEDHLERIEAFNRRPVDPTRWEEKVYRGADYLERMLREKPGSVVVISGNNRMKAEYILACAEAGLNVLADKPMCIDAVGCGRLEEAFAAAGEKGLLIYDIMTERSEITTMLQRELGGDKDLFGKLLPGTARDPAVVKESVHHFSKTVAGRPVKRPAWFFDTRQQGEGIVDVTTHLIDLVMWGCFPEEAIDFERDVKIERAGRWPTLITRKEFEKVTRLDTFPPYLQERLDPAGVLRCYANGEIVFSIKGICAKVSVAWNFQAPEGGGDTHFSVMKGSRASLVIRQGKEEGYRPELYVEPAPGRNRRGLAGAMKRAAARLGRQWPGVGFEEAGKGWRVLIPDKFRVGHEAHFREVVERYLGYLESGSMPAWEAPCMKTKYAITSAAVEMAKRP